MAGKREELVKRRAAFEKNIERWIEIEDLTVGSCDAILKKSKSPVVNALMKAVRMDSQKHKELLQFVQQCLDGTITLTPEELATASDLIEEHVKFERDAIFVAERSLEGSRHFVINQVLKYILDDERKHFSMVTDMNSYKSHIYPYA